MGPEFDDDDEDLPSDEDEAGDETKETGGAKRKESDPLRTSDPGALVRRLRSHVFDLQDRIAAQEFGHRIERLCADLARGADGREADKLSEAARRAEARAARCVPHGNKSAMRTIGRFLARCENAFDDLIGEDNHSLDISTRVQMASAVARLANAASALGNSISSNGRTRALLMRTRDARKPRKSESETPAEQS
ncbi:MAG: hypothetical protein WAW96_08365 [Alphaproteobacteria bacterium]